MMDSLRLAALLALVVSVAGCDPMKGMRSDPASTAKCKASSTKDLCMACCKGEGTSWRSFGATRDPNALCTCN